MTATVQPTGQPTGQSVPDTAGAALHRARQLTVPALRAAVDRLDPASREHAYHHFGFDAADPSRGGGKVVRPALALLSAQAAGAPATTGLPGAVGVELVHNFSLVHDDLMDGDTERRHRITVWARWGSSAAILTGDALLALAQEAVLEATSPHAAPAAALLARTTRELIRGQAEDVAFEQRADVTVEECLSMAYGKTGSLLSASAEIGAVLAGADPRLRAALATFGAGLGVAFQLVDDLLGIWGEPAVTGKPVLSDLRSRKKSLPVTYAVQHGGDAGLALAHWLAAPAGPDGDTEDDLRRAAALVEAGGGREWAVAQARRRMDVAEEALAGARMPDAPRAELHALGRHLIERDF